MLPWSRQRRLCICSTIADSDYAIDFARKPCLKRALKNTAKVIRPLTRLRAKPNLKRLSFPSSKLCLQLTLQSLQRLHNPTDCGLLVLAETQGLLSSEDAGWEFSVGGILINIIARVGVRRPLPFSSQLCQTDSNLQLV
jgi:hypothetical protein